MPVWNDGSYSSPGLTVFRVEFAEWKDHPEYGKKWYHQCRHCWAGSFEQVENWVMSSLYPIHIIGIAPCHHEPIDTIIEGDCRQVSAGHMEHKLNNTSNWINQLKRGT